LAPVLHDIFAPPQMLNFKTYWQADSIGGAALPGYW